MARIDIRSKALYDQNRSGVVEPSTMASFNQASRKIGDTLVPPIGFGAMGISGFYGTVGSDEERFKVLDAAYEHGCTHWDSSDVYADSEELIGKWFKRTGKRNEIFLATKGSLTFSREAGFGVRGDAAYMAEAVNRSLSRLGVDSIDLYYLHRVDLTVPIEFTVGAMAELVKQGKVKYIGLSECSANDLRRAHAVHPISALQIEVSPFVLEPFDPKTGILATARELGITIVAYSPLGRGMLTGRYKSVDDFEADDFRRSIPKYSNENFPKILDIVSKIKEIAATHNATPGQAAIAWVLAQGDDFVTIPGTKNVKYIKENVGAAAVKLTREDIAAITKITTDADLVGGRYADAIIQMMYTDSPALAN